LKLSVTAETFFSHSRSSQAAMMLSKWQPIGNLILSNENSRNLQSNILLPIFHVTLAACHKIDLKKSSMVKNGESEQKYGIYLFKVETFLSKRHQVDMFLSTF